MRLKGTFNPPGDKSISHRLGLISLLAQGKCRVENYSPCADCKTTLEAVSDLGGVVHQGSTDLVLKGIAGRVHDADLDCGNSGTTMRLLMGILAGCKGRFQLIGDSSLSKRPMQRVADPLKLMGARVHTRQGLPPVQVSGNGLQGITYRLPVPSAQLKSALLLAGVQADGVTSVSEPSASRDHSERLLEKCGADIKAAKGSWQIRRSKLSLPETVKVPGDVSSAAFFICGAVITPGSDIQSGEILLNPTRTGFLRVLARMGAKLELEIQGQDPEPWGSLRAGYTQNLRACEVSAGEIPSLIDEVPILALVATQAKGTTVFKDAGELRHKESDRLTAIVSQLSALGADLEIRGDDLFISGPTPLKAQGSLDSFGDHRIAMTLAIAGNLADCSFPIRNQKCVDISYPGFFKQLQGLAS